MGDLTVLAGGWVAFVILLVATFPSEPEPPVCVCEPTPPMIRL